MATRAVHVRSSSEDVPLSSQDKALQQLKDQFRRQISQMVQKEELAKLYGYFEKEQPLLGCLDGTTTEAPYPLESLETAQESFQKNINVLLNPSKLGTLAECLNVLSVFRNTVQKLRAEKEVRSQLQDAMVGLFKLVLKAVTFTELKHKTSDDSSMNYERPFLRLLKDCCADEMWHDVPKDTVFDRLLNSEQVQSLDESECAVQFYLDTEDVAFIEKYCDAFNEVVSLLHRSSPCHGSESTKHLIRSFTVFNKEWSLEKRTDTEHSPQASFSIVNCAKFRVDLTVFAKSEGIVKKLAKFWEQYDMHRSSNVPLRPRSSDLHVRWPGTQSA